MILDKVVATLVQLGVFFCLYVPIMIGYRLYARRQARARASGLMGFFTAGKCLCGKWSLPTGVGAETNVASGVLHPPTSVTFCCPECGVPHVHPVRAMTIRSSATCAHRRRMRQQPTDKDPTRCLDCGCYADPQVGLYEVVGS